jgi:hypothetical protein
MRAAVINSTTYIVENLIVADAKSDPAPVGTFLVNLTPEDQVDIGWIYDPNTQTFSPPNG